MSYRNKFIPKNPQKYRGNPTNIISRSTWELRVMKWLDEAPNVIFWNSEETIIPYISPVDNKSHRYFVDFLVKYQNKDGSIITKLIEIKPFKQTQPPAIQKKKTKRYITEVTTWGVNSAKWEAARSYCVDRGWTFEILTERELGLI